jgi:hypothetical protein
MCSKPNPAGAETCRHCQARLKPIIASSSPSAPQKSSDAKPPASPDGGDWLGNLRSEDESAFSAESSDDTFDSGAGDWFSRLGQDEKPASPKPDWLSAPTEKGDPNIPDWMEELGVAGTTEQAGSDDWSQRFQTDEPAGAASDQDDLKNWLAGLADTDNSQPQKPSNVGFPDWLSSSGQKATPEAPSSQGAKSEASDIPDWLTSLGGDDDAKFTVASPDAEAGVEPASALPDWLTAPGGLPEATFGEKPSSPPTSSDTPDWLTGITAPDLNAAVTEPPQVSDDTLPAWLQDTVESSPDQFDSPITSGREPPTQPINDWLSQFEQVASGGEELPDQMLASEPEPPPASPKEAKKPFPTGALGTGDLSAFGTTPDWLSDLGDLSLGDDVAEQPSEATGTTDWLSGLGDLSGGESSAEPAEAAGTTDWLSGLGDFSMEEPSKETTPAEQSGVSAFVMADEPWSGSESGGEAFAMPDWLSGVSAPEPAAGEAPPIETSVEGETAEDVSPSELPSWLEAMRPLEAAAPATAFHDESDTRVESAGPLSGLRGVLQAEPDIANFRKPPVYLNKLQITDAHQAHMALLEELVASDGKPKPVQPSVPVKSQVVLRLLIALGLIGAVIFGLLGNSTQVVPLPDDILLPQEVKNLRGSIEALPSNAPVLVAIDYQAGSAAEMDYPARVVLQNLEQKNAFLGFVSTNLNGPMLSELLIHQLDMQSNITYTNYTVLGYLPGGSSGLLSFARAPRQTLNHTFFGNLKEDGWSNTQLTAVNLLSDFALVIVMTDNADNARLWIEQVRPQLDGDTPLLMVLSAQAEPLVRPYFQQSLDPNFPRDPAQVQISGYVAGMAGAAAYQHIADPQTIWKDWDALAMASLVAFIMIALGGMINLGLAVSSRPKGKK